MKKRSGKTMGAKVRRRGQSRLSEQTGGPGNALFLVGFMGAGKTSVGRALAQRLNWEFEDLDDRIELRERRSVPQIFRDFGEQEFRRAEHAALEAVLGELKGGAAKVIALGGGAFVQEKNAALLKAAGIPTVFLDAPVEELWQRCCQHAAEAGVERPLLRSIDQFRELYRERRTHYLEASLKVDTGGRTLDEVAVAVVEALRLKRLEMRAQEGDVE